MRTNPIATEWIVLLEAADVRTATSTIDASRFRQFLRAWGTPAPAALYSPERYALQLQINAIDHGTALSAAIRQWRDAVARAGLPEWELVRVEIMTPDEQEREYQTAKGSYGDQPVDDAATESRTTLRSTEDSNL